MGDSLSTERIVRAALDLIDRDGLDAFSTRKLGGALGVEAMSLYHHFPSKGRLLDAVADSLMARVSLPDEPADDPIERLRGAVASYRAVAHAHPNAFLLLAARRFNTGHALAFLESVLMLFRKSGLSPERAARLFRRIGYFLNGALLSELTIRAQTPDPSGSAVDDGVPDTYPAIRESAPYLGASGLDMAFDEGMDAILAQIDAEIRAIAPDSNRGAV